MWWIDWYTQLLGFDPMFWVKTRNYDVIFVFFAPSASHSCRYPPRHRSIWCPPDCANSPRIGRTFWDRVWPQNFAPVAQWVSVQTRLFFKCVGSIPVSEQNFKTFLKGVVAHGAYELFRFSSSSLGKEFVLHLFTQLRFEPTTEEYSICSHILSNLRTWFSW